MFTQNFEAFTTAYSSTSPEIKNLIDSGRAGDFVYTILVNSNYAVLKPRIIIIATYYLLSIITDDQLLSGLMELQIDADTSQQLFSGIKNLRMQEASMSPVSTDIQEVETLLKSLPQTQEEPTYTSTQAAILREGEPSPVPVPPVAGTHRWDSEQRS